MAKNNREKYIVALRQKMLEAAADLEFEEAARLRDMRLRSWKKKPPTGDEEEGV